MLNNLEEKQKKQFIQGAFINLPIGFAIALLLLFGATKIFEIKTTPAEITFILLGLVLIVSAIVYRFYGKLKNQSQTEMNE